MTSITIYYFVSTSIQLSDYFEIQNEFHFYQASIESICTYIFLRTNYRNSVAI